MGDFIWESINKYGINDKMPLGHGEKSVILIRQFITLTPEEIIAIRWHMGFSEEKAMEEYSLVLALHEADLEASKLIEGNDGNKEITDDILPIRVERTSYNKGDDKSNPFE